MERALNYHYLGLHDEAIADYTQAIQLDPTHAAWYVFRAETHAAHGDLDQAVEDARQAVAVDSAHLRSWLRLIDWEIERGAKGEELAKMLVDAEVNAPGSGYLVVGMRRLLSNDREEYDRLCREALARYGTEAKNSTSQHIAHLTASAEVPVVDAQQLVEIARRATDKIPNARAEHTLGLCLLRDKQPEAAIEAFNRSLAIAQLSTWEGVNLVGLAIAHANAGRDREAKELLAKSQQWIAEHPLDIASKMWPDHRMTCELLLREAEQLIELQPAVEGDPAKKTE